MKKLYLVRHAKSDWTYEGLPDIDRPLNERGYRDAHAMSKLMHKKQHLPDAIVSSSAIRAINTALIFARNLQFQENKLMINESLYESTAENFITQISGIHNQYKSLYIFAHNPTITEVAGILTNTPIEHLPTCGIVCIEFKSDSWKATDTAELHWIETPKNRD